MPIRQRHGCLTSLFGLLALGVGVVYGVAALTSPWAFHIGGRSTPLLYWSGSGQLVTKTRTYPLYLYFFPASHSSRLQLDGLRPTGGLQGSGSLCTAPGVILPLKLSGTIYGGWRSTEGSLMTFRLLDRKIFDVGQRQGYFDLYGRWQGQQLVMSDRGRYAGTFRSGLRIERACVTLDWASYADFKAACASAANPPPHR